MTVPFRRTGPRPPPPENDGGWGGGEDVWAVIYMVLILGRILSPWLYTLGGCRSGVQAGAIGPGCRASWRSTVFISQEATETSGYGPRGQTHHFQLSFSYWKVFIGLRMLRRQI
ncbi:hypothetical protein LY78DRAFT_101078 [Colletotrichum sublineola]|nr:hypothetical protein LY78DRAFT_101078 [Colletotrichum sublineola]